MALTVSFSVSQTSGESSVVTITDTSTGSDVAVTQRRVYLRKSDGTFLVPDGTTTDYVEWDYADSSIDIDCLEKDMALEITCEWLNVSDVVVYDASDTYGLTMYNETFDYGLTTVLASNPLLVNDNSFKQNKSDLRVYIDSGDNAAVRSSDIVSAQLCYDQATWIRLNSVYYFNESSS